MTKVEVTYEIRSVVNDLVISGPITETIETADDYDCCTSAAAIVGLRINNGSQQFVLLKAVSLRPPRAS